MSPSTQVLGLVGLVPLLLASRADAQVVDSTTLRPTDVEVTVTNDSHYDGVYRAHGVSRICGKLALMMPHRANSFVVEFPDDDTNLAVRSVSFNADTLPAGGTTTSFHLAVGVRTPTGGMPPLWVVRANEPQYQEPGTAVRTKRASRDVLVVDGIANTGVKVTIKTTVDCAPKP
jgi:hypothetical protein